MDDAPHAVDDTRVADSEEPIEPDVDGPAFGSGPGDVVEDACHDPIRSAWRELEQRFSSGLLTTLGAGLAAHDEVVRRTGLGDGPPPDDWRARADAVLEYRKVVGAELLEPLVETFAKHGPSQAILEAASVAVDRADSGWAELPSSVESEWSPRALEARPSDGFGRRFLKVLARLVSPARKAGRARDLPLRPVAARHVRSTVAPAVDELAGRTLDAWLGWSRRLESVWMDWGDRTMPLFVRIELPEASDADQAWAELVGVVGALHDGLKGLLEDAPHHETAAAVDARLHELRGLLEADLAVAGCFVYRPDLPEGPAASLPRASRRGGAAAAWDEGVAARLRMYVALLGILAGATAVQRRLVWRFREQCVRPLDGLPGIADALDGLAAGLPAGDRPARDALRSLREEVERVLAPALAAVPDVQVVDATVTEGSDATVDALLSMIRQAPATLALHDESDPPPSGPRPADTRALGLQELARQSFDALRIERIRSATVGLIDAVGHVRTDIGELPEVFTFAHDEAVRELDTESDEAETRARELVGEALASMSESLRGQLRALNAAVAEAEKRLAAEVSSGSSALLDRVAAGRMQAGLLAARSRIAELRAWINEHWGPPVDRAARIIALRLAILRRLLSRGVRKGSAMVGGGTGSSAGSTRTLRRLAASSEIVERLPLVYQRLFTLDPLADPALLAGRPGELAEALERWERWRERDGVPLIVRGRPGSGVTSFVNVLGAKVSEDGASSVARIPLDTRVTDEAMLARTLSDGLRLEPCCSLDEVAGAIFASEEEATPALVAIDNLEHVYLRVPGGTALIERLLTLMAETEPRLWWVGGITTSAWQLVASAEPTAVSQVDLLELRPLTTEGVQAAVTVRHRRSGLPVRFEEPSSGRRLLRRRLRRIGDPAAYQEVLERDFFEQLHRSSSAHLPLALFQWLEVADFTSGEGVMMTVPGRPDFSVLESLDLTQNFTLKAFVEHRTLSLDEHDRIFRLPRHESYQIFESLGNRSLIEAVAAPEGPQRSEIEEGLRYRVPSLLTGAVIAHLQGRNIVH